MNTENVEIGDTFPTVSKMIRALGLEPQTGKRNKEYQLIEVCRYLSYEKTGKINPKTHKQSNEIVITDIYDEPLEKVERGRPSIYAQWFYEWMCMYCSCNGEGRTIIKTMAELLKDGEIIQDTDKVSQYFSYEQLELMSKPQLRKHKAETAYKFALKIEFKNKVVDALKKLQKNVPSFEYRLTYKVSYDEKKEFWKECTIEEYKIIKQQIEDCQNEIVGKYKFKNFDQAKWDADAFYEYSKMLNEKLEKYGIYGHRWAVAIDNNVELCNLYNEEIPQEKLRVRQEVLPVIKDLFKKRMEHIIKTRGYTREDKESALGRRNSNIENGKFYTLKYNESVLTLHKSIFGRIETDYDEMFSADDIMHYIAKNQKFKEKFFVLENKKDEFKEIVKQ